MRSKTVEYNKNYYKCNFNRELERGQKNGRYNNDLYFTILFMRYFIEFSSIDSFRETKYCVMSLNNNEHYKCILLRSFNKLAVIC